MDLRQWKMGTAALVALVALLGASYYSHSLVPYSEAATIGSNVTTFKELSDRFVALAEKRGALYAYEVLRHAPLPPNTDLHLLGHVVGDELYKQKGVEGIADCTQDFRNACSHTIVIGTLQDYGPSEEALRLIDESCKQAPGGKGAYTMCYHGLGHGVFAYFGYDLEKTADFCRKMGTAEYHNEQYTQCVGGAIMELMGGGGHDHELWLAARQKYLTDDPLAPCTSAVVPNDTKTFCYTYLTPRLFEFAGAELGAPDPKTFPKAFSFCDALPHSEQRQRDSCFGGFGKEFVPLAGARDVRVVDSYSDAQYAQASSWCALSGPDDGKAACIVQALESVFWGGENDPQASLRFCGDTPAKLQAACYEHLAKQLSQYLPQPDAAAWCDKLPPSYQSSCAVPQQS